MNQIPSTFGIASALAMILIIMSLCRNDIRELVSARCVFLITLLGWFLLEAALAPEALRQFSSETYVLGIVCVWVCAASFLIAYNSSRGGVFDPMFRQLAIIDYPRLIWLVFLIALFIGFLPLLVYAEGDVLAILKDAFAPRNNRWGSMFQRSRYGGFRDAFLELRMFLRAALPLAAAILVQKRQGSARRAFAAFFLAYMFSDALNSGTRSRVLEVILPICAACYWRMPKRQKRYALYVGLPGMVMLILLWSAATVSGRNEGRIHWSQATEVDYVGFEMFRELLFLIDTVPERADFRYGRTYYVQLVNPIPRAIWKGKPDDDAGLELARIKGMIQHGEAYLTNSPGLIGEMYWNGGLPGIILISALLGYLAKSWDRIRPYASQSILAFTVFSGGLGVIVLSGRSINMTTLYGMLALFAALVLFQGTTPSSSSPSPKSQIRRSRTEKTTAAIR